MNTAIKYTKNALKDLKSVPEYIKDNLEFWAEQVETYGLRETREKYRSYHDEPLKGDRQGQRSIRLSKGYRAIYSVSDTKEITIVFIEEVNKHKY